MAGNATAEHAVGLGSATLPPQLFAAAHLCSPFQQTSTCIPHQASLVKPAQLDGVSAHLVGAPLDGRQDLPLCDVTGESSV